MTPFSVVAKAGRLAAVACLAGATATPALAVDYFLSVPITANETGKGTLASPFHTMWMPNHVLKPGDTLHVMPGTYPMLYIGVSGNSSLGGMISIVGDQGARPVFSVTSGNAVQFMTGVSYIKLSNFETVSTAMDKNGVFLETSKPVNHIVLDQIYSHDNSCAGINAMRADYVTVTNSIIANNSASSSLGCSGIDFYQATNSDTLPGIHNVISGNVVYGNQNLVPAPGKTLISDGNGIIIDDFKHTQLGYTAPPFVGTTLVENNVIYDNGGRAVHVYYSQNVIVRNNTTYKNEKSAAYNTFGFGEIEALFSDNVQIYNNVMTSLRPTDYAVWFLNSTGIDADYNTYYGGLAAKIQTTSNGPNWGSHNKFGNPLLKNPSTNPAVADFHITGSSPAVNAAIPNVGFNGPVIDRDNNQRPTSGPINAGAYQNPQ